MHADIDKNSSTFINFPLRGCLRHAQYIWHAGGMYRNSGNVKTNLYRVHSGMALQHLKFRAIGITAGGGGLSSPLLQANAFVKSSFNFCFLCSNYWLYHYIYNVSVITTVSHVDLPNHSCAQEMPDMDILTATAFHKLHS